MRTSRTALVALGLGLCLLAACSSSDDEAAPATTAPPSTESTTTTTDDTTGTTTPDVVPFQAIDVASGDQHACALDPDGAAWCWGYNNQGQLGDGTDDSSNVPVRVDTDERFVQLSGGRYFTCGLTAEGAAWCWGDNSRGELGNGETGAGSDDADQSTPVAVATDVAFDSIVTGQLHTCGLTAAGEAWCWGAYASGQLGNGAGEDQAVPVRSAEGLTFASLAFGGDTTTCGLTAEGAAWCWGSNNAGQLGNGEQTNARQPEPSAVVGGHAFVDIALGTDHTCAIDVDGTAWCWGSNTFGQTGAPASDDDVLEPTAVATDASFVSITADGGFTCAIDTDGAGSCWGRGIDGRLGVGSDDDTDTPTPIAGDLAFAEIDAGEEFACGLTTDGEVWCWGSNRSGWLGTGDDEPSEVPVPVITPDEA